LFKRSDVDEYNDLLADLERLRAIIGDQQILLDEHRMDNQHAYEEGGNAERAAVVAWLRSWDGSGWAALDHAAACIERGEHRRKEKP